MHMTPIAALNREVGRNARVAAMLTSVRTLVTKSGRKMAILRLEDQTSSCEVTLFNRLYQQVIDLLIVDEPLVIIGKVEKDDFNGGVRLVSEKIMTLMAVREQHVKRLLLKLPEDKRTSQTVSQLSLLMKPFCGGSCPVVIGYQGDLSSVDIRLGDEWCVRPEMALVKQLQQALGKDAVVLEY